MVVARCEGGGHTHFILLPLCCDVRAIFLLRFNHFHFSSLFYCLPQDKYLKFTFLHCLLCVHKHKQCLCVLVCVCLFCLCANVHFSKLSAQLYCSLLALIHLVLLHWMTVGWFYVFMPFILQLRQPVRQTEQNNRENRMFFIKPLGGTHHIAWAYTDFLRKIKGSP